MKRFAVLFSALDQTSRTSEKVSTLAEYLTAAPDSDRLWTIALMLGRRPKRTVTTARLREWAAEQADIPLWLFDESSPVVGDLAETIALVLPAPTGSSDKALTEWIIEIRGLAELEEKDRKTQILEAWDQLDTPERFIFNKLVTGGLRMGVSQKLITRALARTTGNDEPELAHRLMGKWTPDDTTFDDLFLAPNPDADLSKPYPLNLAFPLDTPVTDLGDPAEWSAEHKWDGIRGQLVLRGGDHHLWSRGEELITDRFPEFAVLANYLRAGTVIDGEILAWIGEKPMSFASLQKRMGRKTVPAKLLKDTPVILRAYDLLEIDGHDIRAMPFADRRARLDALLANVPPEAPLRMSPLLDFTSWDDLARERARSREIAAEGLMLKRKHSPYRDGRHKGDWWTWKVDPLVIDAVMIYAQSDHGPRAGLFNEFTLAVWDGNALVPFTKVKSGLADAELREITAWVRKNTIERFGPVRSVKAAHVFEIAFEGIAESPRHKSGVALRFPRIALWHKDKPVSEVNTLADLKVMLDAFK